MFGRALLLLRGLALGAAAAASPEVLRLDADSFEPSIASRPFVAVAFVAPWCAHCKRLEPSGAPRPQLAARGRNITLATLDTTAGDANAALAARHDVRGFPSIRIFRDGDLQSAEAYEGPRAADGVVATLERLEASAETILATPSEAEAFVRSSPVVVLGVLDGSVEEDAPLARAFGAAARAFAGDPDDPDDWQSVPFGVVALPALVPERTTRPFANALKEDGRGPARRGRPGVRAFDARVSRFRFADASFDESSHRATGEERSSSPWRRARCRASPRWTATRGRARRSGACSRTPGRCDRVRGRRARRREMAETMARVAEQAEREASESESESESVGDEDAASNAALVVGVAAENANALAFFDVGPSACPRS